VAVRRGVIVVIVLIFIAVAISTAGLIVMGLAVGRTPQIASNSTLLLNVGGDLQEVEPSGVIGQFLEAPPTVRSIVDALRKASIDRRVSSVIIRPTNTAALWGKAQEVREAIVEFKKSKKPIIAYLEFGGDQNYYLASACDKVFLMPTASLDLTGIASYELFLRGTLDKVGVVPDSLHVGDYKTASNTFTEHTFTAAHREMAQSLNTDLYEQLIAGLADGRHRTPAEMRALIDHGPYLPEDAVRAGLVDDLAYEDEIDDKVVLGGGGRTRMLKQQEYRAVGLNSLGLNRGPRIALIYAVGTITSGVSSESPSGQVVGSDTIVEYLRKARADTSIRAIVLRIDSPGGSAVASDIIWREIMLTRDQKPVIASMSDVAASGGYYIAMPAHAIVAQPATLTGSIGVVMIRFVIDGTLDKLGLNLETVKSGKYADLFSPVRPFTPDERKKVGELMQATYDSFVEKAAAGRNTTPERIDAIAQGRVWTGKQAKELGLVDELGGLDKALALAKERAKIAASSEVELVVFPPKKTLFDVVSEPLNRPDGSAALTSLLGNQNARALEAVTSPLRMFRRGEPLTLMPNVFVGSR
jgi:protease IV